MNTCFECRYCWRDDRHTDYRRDPCWFCLRHGAFFSRNTPVGTQNRIVPAMPACPDFAPKPPADFSTPT